MGTPPPTETLSHTAALRAALLAALVVGSAVAAGTAFAGAAAAQDEASVGFSADDPSREMRVGDLVEPWTIGMSGTDTVTLVLSSHNVSDGSYAANVTVQDTDGNGVVRIGMNTFAAGHSNPWIVESGEVTSSDQTELGESELPPKTASSAGTHYNVFVGAGSDPAGVAAEPMDETTMEIDDGETQGFDPATAPGADEYESLSEIYNEPDTYADLYPKVSTEGDQIVAQGDTLMFNPWGSGYFGMAHVAMNRTESPEDAFLWLLDRGYLIFNVSQTSFNAGDREPKELNVSRAVELDALEFNANQSYGHLLITLRTDAAVFQRGGTGEFVTPAPGDVLEANFAKDRRVDPDVLNRDTQFLLTRNFSVVAGAVDIEPPVRTLEDGKIGGTTTYATGTNFTVYVKPGEGDVQVHEIDVKQDEDRHYAPTLSGGIEEHIWNFSVDVGDVESTAVKVAVTGRDGTLLAAEPRGFVPDLPGTSPIVTTTAAPTTDDPGGDGDTTTPGDGTAAPDETTTGPGETTAGDGGDGGTIPGFTATAALLAVVAAALLALRRD